MATHRQAKILQYLASQDSVDIAQLSELLQVSPSTIRRELRTMEHNGLLVRTHGAARLPLPIHYEAMYENRAAQQIEAKRKIAVRATELIKPGLVVGMTGGTTCTELARLLRAVPDITIVTNAINIALELKGQLDRRIMVTGGMFNRDSYELVGNLVVQSLQNVHLDLTFIGVVGIGLDFGFSVSDEPEAMVGRVFMAAAERTVALADHTKIGRATFARLCPLAAVKTLVTDNGIAYDQLVALQGAGLEVLVGSSVVQG